MSARRSADDDLVRRVVGRSSPSSRTATPPDAAWTTLVRPLPAVAPDADVESTLQFFQREGATVCVVRDGDTPVGIVTIEDVLEQVVGRFEDEYPRHPKLALRDILLTDDPLLDLTWPLPVTEMSEKDASWPLLAEAEPELRRRMTLELDPVEASR